MTLTPSLAALDFNWSAKLARSVTPTKSTVPLLPTASLKLEGVAAVTSSLTSVLADAVKPPIAPFKAAAMLLAEAPPR
ncbi:hypothetical protein D3C80_2042230 [compost metagenome]